MRQNRGVEHEQFLTTEQVAEYLGVPAPSVRQWQYRGKGPRSYKIGRHRRYRMSDVDTWVEQQASADAAPKVEAP